MKEKFEVCTILPIFETWLYFSAPQTIPELPTVITPLQNLAASNSSNAKLPFGEVQKRLSLLETLWREEKLEPEVKIRMLALVQALEAGEFQKADDIHVSLLADYFKSCSSWMIGVKKLIAVLKEGWVLFSYLLEENYSLY